MSITVRRLIAELKKLPPNAKVCWADHDHDWQSGEINGGVNNVDEASDAVKDRGYGVVLS